MCTAKDRTIVKYTLPEDNKISTFQNKLYLPTEKELIGVVKEEKKYLELIQI